MFILLWFASLMPPPVPVAPPVKPVPTVGIPRNERAVNVRPWTPPPKPPDPKKK